MNQIARGEPQKKHAHPKARPEPALAPATGIAYLQPVADTHHAQVAAEQRIGFHALYSTDQQPTQLAEQLSLDDALREINGDQQPAAGQ